MRGALVALASVRLAALVSVHRERRMDEAVKDGGHHQYFEEVFPGYKHEPSTLKCGHLTHYACPFCGECYPCKHKLIQFGDGTLHWKCRNGKKHIVKGVAVNCSKCGTYHPGRACEEA